MQRYKDAANGDTRKAMALYRYNSHIPERHGSIEKLHQYLFFLTALTHLAENLRLSLSKVGQLPLKPQFRFLAKLF